MTNKIIHAHVEMNARDCDGAHWNAYDFNMEDSEINDQFGDLAFYARVLGYVVSFHAQDGTLRITQDEDGLPVFDWSMSTEEGFHSERATFHNGAAE